jgi:hypothetical protein
MAPTDISASTAPTATICNMLGVFFVEAIRDLRLGSRKQVPLEKFK